MVIIPGVKIGENYSKPTRNITLWVIFRVLESKFSDKDVRINDASSN